MLIIFLSPRILISISQQLLSSDSIIDPQYLNVSTFLISLISTFSCAVARFIFRTYVLYSGTVSNRRGYLKVKKDELSLVPIVDNVFYYYSASSVVSRGRWLEQLQRIDETMFNNFTGDLFGIKNIHCTSIWLYARMANVWEF